MNAESNPTGRAPEIASPRRRKEAQALRDNLSRRKAQARARAEEDESKKDKEKQT